MGKPKLHQLDTVPPSGRTDAGRVTVFEPTNEWPPSSGEIAAPAEVQNITPDQVQAFVNLQVEAALQPAIQLRDGRFVAIASSDSLGFPRFTRTGEEKPRPTLLLSSRVATLVKAVSDPNYPGPGGGNRTSFEITHASANPSPSSGMVAWQDLVHGGDIY